MVQRAPMPDILPDDETSTAGAGPSNVGSDAHLGRNEHMQNWVAVPPTYPEDLPYFDPTSGATVMEDDWIGEEGWHGGNDCVRIVPPAVTVQELRDDPQYRDDFNAMAAGHDFDVDEVIPGAQVCYDPNTGDRIDNGPYVGTWDYASPAIPGQGWEHWVMDMVPDWSADNYATVPLVTQDPLNDVTPGSPSEWDDNHDTGGLHSADGDYSGGFSGTYSSDFGGSGNDGGSYDAGGGSDSGGSDAGGSSD